MRKIDVFLDPDYDPATAKLRRHKLKKTKAQDRRQERRDKYALTHGELLKEPR